MKIGNKSIKEIVKKDIYGIWDNISVEKARDELKKMYLRYYNVLTDIEEKKLILHNLCVAEMQSKDYSIESAQKYTEVLLADMDNTKGYKENEPCEYCKVLNNYIETHKNYISKNELIKLYELCNDIYSKNDDCSIYGNLAKLSIEFNLNLIKNNFDTVLNIIEAVLIHIDDINYNDMLNQFIDDIKAINNIDLLTKVLKLKNDNQIIKIS